MVPRKPLLLIVTLFSLFAAVAAAGTLTLKNGEVVTGTVVKQGDNYWVKAADGSTKLIPVADVDHVGGSATPPSVAPSPAAPIANPTASSTPNYVGSSSYQEAKSNADRVDAPILAVSIWEKFLDAKPNASDTTAAQAELDKWKALDKQHAEKINGKWIGGDDRKKLLKQVHDLIKQADEEVQGSETLKALADYEKALALYPNSFEANFELGYFYLVKGAVGSNGQGNLGEMDKAIKSLEAAAKLRPTSAAAFSNLAIGYNFRRHYLDAVKVAYKAAKIEDSKDIVQNLVDSIAHAPPGMQQNNQEIKPIMEEAFVLAHKHGIDPKGGEWFYIRPHQPGVDENGKPTGEHSAGDDENPEDDLPPGVVASGSGFFITPDGYFLTNKHVAEKNRSFRARFEDGTERNADVVAVDDEADIALMHIKLNAPNAFLKLSPADEPNPAAHVMVLGYPASFQLGFHMQVTTGDVTSIDPEDKYNVTLTLNTTHGNSGGPIVDKDENVIGILSAGQQIYNVTYVKAISCAQIRKFLGKIKAKFPQTLTAGGTSATSFDGEKLAADARKSTLLVFIIKGASDAPSEKPSDSTP